MAGILRDVRDSDLEALYQHQRDPEATRMAAFPPRERAAFEAHWRRVLADASATARTIESDGDVAGWIGAYDLEGRRFVGYWIGREFWGRGLATAALAELLDVETARPLHAYVVRENVGSIRVLEKCGFVEVASSAEYNEALGESVEEVLMELR